MEVLASSRREHLHNYIVNKTYHIALIWYVFTNRYIEMPSVSVIKLLIYDFLFFKAM